MLLTTGTFWQISIMLSATIIRGYYKMSLREEKALSFLAECKTRAAVMLRRASLIGKDNMTVTQFVRLPRISDYHVKSQRVAKGMGNSNSLINS